MAPTGRRWRSRVLIFGLGAVVLALGLYKHAQVATHVAAAHGDSASLPMARDNGPGRQAGTGHTRMTGRAMMRSSRPVHPAAAKQTHARTQAATKGFSSTHGAHDKRLAPPAATAQDSAQPLPGPPISSGPPKGSSSGSGGRGSTVPARHPSQPPPRVQPHLMCSSLPPFDPAHNLQHFAEFVDSNWAAMGAVPTQRSTAEYLQYLYPYVACDSGLPTKASLRPEPVKYSCTGPFWAGPRSKPKKIVSFVPFAYELDMLEVRLHEHEDVVDLTVLSESVYTHRVVRKPLFFERSKERYGRFADGILHVIDDEVHFYQQRQSADSSSAKIGAQRSDDWRNENRMRTYPWTKFLEATGLRPEKGDLDDYLILVGDMDEIPSAEQLAHFKYCQPRSASPHFRLAAVFYTHTFKHTKPEPSTPEGLEFSITLSDASVMVGRKELPRKVGEYYKEQRGWIMNRMFSSYTDMFKELSIAEGGCIPQKRPRELASNPLMADEWRSQGLRTCCFSDKEKLRPPPADHKPPWYAAQNAQRFPYMFAS